MSVLLLALFSLLGLARSLSPPPDCQLERREALNSPLIGVFVPRCTSRGDYQEKQCHASTGYCWCVDPLTGKDIVGTSSRGEVNCGSRRPSCGANEEFTTCGTSCPSTCRDRDIVGRICPEVCVEGCFCREGYVRKEQNGECVLIEQCPGIINKLSLME